MRIVGIDPGLSGALALVIDGRPTKVVDMPIMARGGAPKRQKLAAPLLVDEIVEMAPDKVWVERVSAMPGQGVASTFSFGESCGTAIGICFALRIPVWYVTPQTWKRHARLIGAEKDASRTLAIERYPHMAPDLSRKRDHGRADAILIAIYGWDNEQTR